MQIKLLQYCDVITSDGEHKLVLMRVVCVSIMIG